MTRQFIVYMHVNKVNNKKYVGKTCQSPKKRWKHGSCYKGSPHFYRAIQKYGWDNFEHLILFTNLSEEEASKKEIELIEQYQLRDPQFGYNVTAGGEGRLKYTTEEEILERKQAEKIWQDSYNKEHKQYFKAKNQEYYNADPDKFKQRAQQYYKEHIDEQKAYSKNYKLTHKEQIKTQSKFHREQIKKLREQLLEIARQFPELFSEQELLKLSKRDTCRSIAFLINLLERIQKNYADINN